MHIHCETFEKILPLMIYIKKWTAWTCAWLLCDYDSIDVDDHCAKKVLNLISQVSEISFLVHHEPCECKCRLNKSVCN